MKKWQLMDALKVFEKLDGPVHKAGYTLSMYGSIMTPAGGNDLDLVALSWRIDADRMNLIRAIESSIPFIFMNASEHILEKESIMFRDEQFRVIDLCVVNLKERDHR